MRRHLIGIIGIVFVVVGLLGAGVAGALLAASHPSVTYAPGTGMMGRRYGGGGVATSAPGGAYGNYASPGQRIFFTGIGHSGSPIPRQGGIGMMGAGGCANCHGTDGRGRNIGGMMTEPIDVPDIRYSTLTSPKTDEASGTTQPGWSDAQIAAAIRDGKDPDDGSLKTFMPRWQMDDQDMADIIGYLKELK